MDEKKYILESNVPFAESIIWKINQAYYQEAGLDAWSDGVVPHAMTSSAFVGKTYAALILGHLKDISSKQAEQLSSDEKVYIIELGAGHGRLAFHILSQLDYMIAMETMKLPDYCFVLTDIVESNLQFFQNHPQFKSYLDQGKLDVAFLDGTLSKEIKLRNSDNTVSPKSLSYPIIALANYFFDSLPNDLFKIENQKATACNISISSALDPANIPVAELIPSLETSINESEEHQYPSDSFLEVITREYAQSIEQSYILIPRLATECIENLKDLSDKGLMLISMDKGYNELKDLQGRPKPELINHGSFSVYVNYHALDRYCNLSNGKSLFASNSDFSLKLACMMFLPDPDSYTETLKAYQGSVNNFGPDEFIAIQKFVFRNRKDLSLVELMSSMRLADYDSTLFLNLLPHIKEHAEKLTMDEHKRLSECLSKVGANYFAIHEPVDISYELGGLQYDLGLYEDALRSFEKSSLFSGEMVDLYYNKILCHYQLRQDEAFVKMLAEAKGAFPTSEKFAALEKLDLSAV